MTKLLIVSSAPVVPEDEYLYLDVKFYTGMQYYCEHWDGPITAISVAQDEKYPFGGSYAISDLPYEARALGRGQRVELEDIRGFDVILCSGDAQEFLHLAEMCRAEGIPLVYMIENILETRFQIVSLDRDRNLLRRLYSKMWLLWQEGRRRKAFRLASGLQANGYPAHEAYKALNDNTMFYLDSRNAREMFANPSEREARRAHLLGGGPLRLIYSGRLERLKGVQDLVPVAKELARLNVDFELHIFGEGSLEGQIRQDVAAAGLQSQVQMYGTVDFSNELVPFTREKTDIFLSCHRQSDPSCTYLEAMGCGIPIIGYANRMWSALCRESKAGWVVPLGDPIKMAQEIARLNTTRDEIADACDKALHMAQSNDFKQEFSRRIDHLREAIAR